jgi:hypothetical protein
MAAGATYETYRDKIANFQADMLRLTSEIRSAADQDNLAFAVAQPQALNVPGAPPSGSWASPANRYYEMGPNTIEISMRKIDYPYTKFRGDIDTLTYRLEYYADGADPSRFDDVVDRIEQVVSQLDKAQSFDGGMNAVSQALGGWAGGAARNFENAVIVPFGRVTEGQAKLARELAVAARCYQEIVGRAQVDSLDLAVQLKEKIVRDDEGEVDLAAVVGVLLMIAGAAAGGVGALASGAAWAGRIAWSAGTSQLVLKGIEASVSEVDAPDRVIEGGYAAEFVPSADELLSTLSDQAPPQEVMIWDGFKADQEELDELGLSEIEFEEPDLVGANDIADLGARDAAVEVENIAKLKRIGLADLPAIAECFHQAHLDLGAVRYSFDQGIGDRHITGQYRYWFEDAADQLDTALTRARDYVYQSAQSLVKIADGYYEGETENQERLARLVDNELEDFPYDIYDTYEPPPPVTARSPGHQEYV